MLGLIWNSGTALMQTACAGGFPLLLCFCNCTWASGVRSAKYQPWGCVLFGIRWSSCAEICFGIPVVEKGDPLMLFVGLGI